MTTHKTADLIGWRLDLAVALAQGAKHWTFHEPGGVFVGFDPDVEAYEVGHRREFTLPLVRYAPSTDWFDGGPILEREATTLDRDSNPAFKDIPWMAIVDRALSRGPTPLVAAMRAYLQARVGETVELPA